MHIKLTKDNLEAGAHGNGTKGYRPYLRLHVDNKAHTYPAYNVEFADLQEAIEKAEQWKSRCIEANKILEYGELNDVGPAFASGSPEHGGNARMALRDWFAGQALASLCNAYNDENHASDNAKIAYANADAMLKRREMDDAK